MKWIVMGLLTGLLALSCSSPTEPDNFGCVVYGKVTCQEQVDLREVRVSFHCIDCDTYVVINPNAEGSYRIEIDGYDKHQGHTVQVYAYYSEVMRTFDDSKTWIEYPTAPVEWNPELK